jgi:hypothetical protein
MLHVSGTHRCSPLIYLHLKRSIFLQLKLYTWGPCLATTLGLALNSSMVAAATVNYELLLLSRILPYEIGIRSYSKVSIKYTLFYNFTTYKNVYIKFSEHEAFLAEPSSGILKIKRLESQIIYKK